MVIDDGNGDYSIKILEHFLIKSKLLSTKKPRFTIANSGIKIQR